MGKHLHESLQLHLIPSVIVDDPVMNLAIPARLKFASSEKKKHFHMTEVVSSLISANFKLTFH